MIMKRLFQILGFASALLVLLTAQAEIVAETLDHPAFGPLAIQRPTDEPKGVLLFLSGAEGWTPELTTAAREVADLDYIVVGVDLPAYQAHLADAACVDVSTALDQLNQFIEQRQTPVTHRAPIVFGYGAGAALGYAALVQAPVDQFHAGVGVNFCPELPLRKPLCPGVGKLESAALPDPQGTRLIPASYLATTWFVFENQTSCPAAAPFVQSIPLARWTAIPGATDVKTWLPQVSALLQWLDPGIAHQARPDASVNNVPLIEVPVTGGPQRPQLAVMLSGDGGWAELDRTLSAELAKNGLPTVGWDSLSYFWKARQPEEVALDLERVLRHYLSAWHKERLVLIGYSFGADVLPAVIHRLPSDLRERIDLTVLLGLSDYASFEFHLSNWISDDPDEGDLPVRPELEKIKEIKKLCIYGADEEDSACPKAAALGVIADKMPGDHHFDEDYPAVARRILQQLPSPAPAPTPKG